jgi:hypothetical protein
MGQERREPDLAALLVDGRGLDRGNLVLAEAFTDDVKPAGQRRVAEGPVGLPGKRRADGGRQRLFRIAQVALGPAAMAPMVSLERCIGGFLELKADGAGFRAPGS